MDIGDEAAVKEGSEEVARPPLNPYTCSSEHGRGDPWSAICEGLGGRLEGNWKKGGHLPDAAFTRRGVHVHVQFVALYWNTLPACVGSS